MADMLDSEEAARHLGIKVATLYAYVSRGVVVSHPVPGSRRRRFARDDLDRLMGRARPSRSEDTRVASVVTGVTHIEADGPRYRGHRVQDLIRTHSFEQLCDLLWEVEGSATPWEGLDLPGRAQATAALGDGDLIRYAVVAAGAVDPFRGDQRLSALPGAARRLIATVVDTLPFRAGGRGPLSLVPTEGALRRPSDGRSRGPVDGRSRGPLDGRRRAGVPGSASIAQRLSAAVNTRLASPAEVAAIDAAMVIMADHELATATLAARVAASTRADLYGVVLSGLGAMSGRLHGAASNQVRPLLDDAQWQGPAEALGRVLRQGPVVVGFGHGLYDGGDPRARWLLDEVRTVASPEQWRIISTLLAVAEEQGVAPANVDFALGALAWVGAMVPGASETIATVARIAGWVAHALEEYEEAPLRFRARALYRSES